MTGPTSGWIIGATDTITKFGTNPVTYQTSQAPMALRWNGARWASEALPAPDQTQVSLRLTGVPRAAPAMSGLTDRRTTHPSPSPATSLSDHDYLIHYDGVRWTRVALPPVAALNPNHDATTFNTASFPIIAPTGNGGLWIAGGLNVQQNQTSSYRPLLCAYHGGQWTTIPLPK